MRRRQQSGAGIVALSVAVALTLITGTAQAERWAILAPAPLASDSSYAALQARPADSLSGSEAQWLAVQRDWRVQRDMEERWPGGSQLRREWLHRERRNDTRFATLASLPYAALTDSERAWLVAESAAQRSDQLTPRVGVNPLGLLLTGVVVGLVALAVGLRHMN